MSGAYYFSSIPTFLAETGATIRDALTERTSKSFYQLLSSQSESWSSQIDILKKSLQPYSTKSHWGVLFEYSIPRRSKRIDIVLLIENVIIVIEFKDGESKYNKDYILQVEDYCLDLRDFHYASKEKIIIPILLCTDAKERVNEFIQIDDFVQKTIYANRENLSDIISKIISLWGNEKQPLDLKTWNSSKYFPTPTIIEAAQSLYSGQSVKEISRSHAGAENLTLTTNAVLSAIRDAQSNNSKIICFITGVPGAGKTLAGLNIVHNREFKTNDKELGVFLSGNSPLVKVLTEALARDVSRREKINKKEANRRISAFIHNVHQFIDAYYDEKDKIPVDRVLIYDEAQRAWTKEYKYFKSKKRINASEPEILLSIMNRFKNSWSVIVALVGEGQEINTGEGGLREWGKTLTTSFSEWKVYISPELKTGTQNGNSTLFPENPRKIQIKEDPNLHLNVSIRSYKAKELSNWVNYLLSNQPEKAKEVFDEYLMSFPVFITRSLNKAKDYLRAKTRGSRRSGILASSGARRLRSIGLDINSGLKGISSQNELGAWYLNPREDVRSSSFLEIASSEFGVQGLELDWTCVCWDADLRRNNNNWDFKSFEGTKWSRVLQPEQQQFILNKYRVLLTRAREGMILFIPEGNTSDITRRPEFYDPVYEYLISCGIQAL